jgi:hypothetical protein
MDYVSDAEGDESEIDAESAEAVDDLEREDGEVLTAVASDGADDVNDDSDAAQGGAGADDAEPEPQVIAEVPKKRAPRAKKPAVPKKPTTRKKPAE